MGRSGGDAVLYLGAWLRSAWEVGGQVRTWLAVIREGGKAMYSTHLTCFGWLNRRGVLASGGSVCVWRILGGCVAGAAG